MGGGKQCLILQGSCLSLHRTKLKFLFLLAGPGSWDLTTLEGLAVSYYLTAYMSHDTVNIITDESVFRELVFRGRSGFLIFDKGIF